MRPRRGGFTLIELLAGTAVMVILLAGAISVLLAASAQHRRSVEKANLERACTRVIGQLEAELRQAGLGVPRGSEDTTGNRFPAVVLAANPGDIAFIADLARPNSSFNGISRLSDDQVSIGSTGVAILNELNGTCDVDSNGHCRTDLSSALFGPGVDCATNPNAPTCPWSLQKYQPQEWIILANGAGEWLERQLPVGPPLSGVSGTRRFLAVQGARPLNFFANLPNRGFISTPDRVFYRLNGAVVERRQCWAAIGNAPTVGSLTGACADGTGWEPRAGDATALSFEYRDAADNVLAAPVPAADLRRIRRVIVTLTLQRAVGPSAVDATAVGSASVRL